MEVLGCWMKGSSMIVAYRHPSQGPGAISEGFGMP